MVGLDPKLFEVLRLAGNTDVETGYARFDKLNNELGLAGLQTSYGGGGTLLCFGEQINVPAAAAAYEDVDGVEYAERNGYGYAGETIPNDIEATKEGDTWYVVLRESGVMFADPTAVYFFTVSGDIVTELASAEAASSTAFARLTQACAATPC
jgi:hypothetical protein